MLLGAWKYCSIHTCTSLWSSAAKSVLDNMMVGEVTEIKKEAIQSTMRKYAHQMCERISVTCLAVILYSLEVIDYTVFAKFGNISAGIMQDAHFLVSEVIKAVHNEAKKFEPFCQSISLVHSQTYADEIWSELYTTVCTSLSII